MFMFILYIQGAPTCLCLFYIFKGLQHVYVYVCIFKGLQHVYVYVCIFKGLQHVYVYVCIFKGLQHVYVYVLYKKTNMKSFEMNKK